MPLSPERQKAIVERQIDDITLALADARREDSRSFTVKQMEKTKKTLEAKLQKLNDQTRKDDVVTFEELGVVHQTIPKMQRLTEPQFKGLELEWYKPDEPNKKTEVAEK